MLPQCLQLGEGFWILERLQTVALKELLARDEDLCNCFLWAREDIKSRKMLYVPFGPTLEIRACAPPENQGDADVDQDTPEKKLVVRSLSESFLAIKGDESLELTKRVLGFPKKMSERLPELFAGTLEIVGQESPALMAMGLENWKVSKRPGKLEAWRWTYFEFHRPQPKIPLAIFQLCGDFFLPGGDGCGTVTLGYVSTDLDFVVASRDFSEYPIHRRLATKASWSWEEAEAELKLGCYGGGAMLPGLDDEGTENQKIFAKINMPDGWEVEESSTYLGDDRCVMGSPHLEAVYQDAKRLAAEPSEGARP